MRDVLNFDFCFILIAKFLHHLTLVQDIVWINVSPFMIYL